MNGTPIERLLPRLKASFVDSELFDALAENDDEVFVVGGAIRDAYLERPIREVDFAVEGDARIVAATMQSTFGGSLTVHDRFRTASLELPSEATFDFASTRVETYEHPGALPDPKFNVSIDMDLARRDFTVNAMAVRLRDGKLVAHPDSLKDLDESKLAILHENSFFDDPTRILRLLRYQARLGFRASYLTSQCLERALSERVFASLSGERVGAELLRLIAEPQPNATICLDRSGVGVALFGTDFRGRPELVEDVQAHELAQTLTAEVALAGALLDVPIDALETSLSDFAFPARLRGPIISAVRRAAEVAIELKAVKTLSELWLLGEHESALTLVLGAALAGESELGRVESYLRKLREMRLGINGQDLRDAGLTGGAIGAGLRAAMLAVLDDGGLSTEQQLAIALAAARE